MCIDSRLIVGVVAVSWYPNGEADDEGLPPDPLIPILLEYADKYDLKVGTPASNPTP